MIHIEIIVSKKNKSNWDMRIGDIGSCSEVSNITKENLLEVISQELDTHMEAVIDK